MTGPDSLLQAPERRADKPSVHEAVSAVMEAVQAIGKTDRNKRQNFDFRGIDTVINAVGPELRKHGVVVMPHAEHIEFHDYETSTGTAMRNCVVRVRFRFTGPAGDTMDAVTYGEASDAGDKSVSKAQSVAQRVALLQALTVPTDEPDPDAESHERTSRPQAQQNGSDDFAVLAGRLSEPQRQQMRAWRMQQGFPDPSQMNPDQRASAVAYMRELVG